MARLTAIYGSLSILGARYRENRRVAGIDIETANHAPLSDWGTVAFTEIPFRDGAERPNVNRLPLSCRTRCMQSGNAARLTCADAVEPATSLDEY